MNGSDSDGQEEEDGDVLEIHSNTAEMIWHEVQVQAVVDDAMVSDIPKERLPIDGVATEDIPLHPEPLHPEQPTCSKDCPTDITEAGRGDFEIYTDPFPNTLEDDGVPVYPWTKRGRRLNVPHRF